MAVVTTGFFDGVHLGHRHVLSDLVAAARERGESSVVATFWPHPRTILQDGARELRLLSSLDEKKELTDDSLKEYEEKVQKITDKYIKNVDDTCAKKEKELMEI